MSGLASESEETASVIELTLWKGTGVVGRPPSSGSRVCLPKVVRHTFDDDWAMGAAQYMAYQSEL